MEILSSRILVRPRDWELSRTFYAETLGLAVAREFPGGVVFFLGTGYLELSKAGAVAVGDDALWLQVRSLPDAVAELRGRGVTITREPAREPWGLDECWIADPDGRAIVLVEIPPGHPIRTDLRT
ncbi:VOC family protein [Actinomycetospora callitridis]|uniref:VOC family protein n=1 Tax=Actinomycetospora callitridis TaxID=913944 RepID=UPI0023665F9C|nr:VOC family protein [Actinomycetospora callitridis]MDD7918164.1 VOC family protein [Actinomycetospora callitridis]